MVFYCAIGPLVLGLRRFNVLGRFVNLSVENETGSLFGNTEGFGNGDVARLLKRDLKTIRCF